MAKVKHILDASTGEYEVIDLKTLDVTDWKGHLKPSAKYEDLGCGNFKQILDASMGDFQVINVKDLSVTDREGHRMPCGEYKDI